MDRIIDIINLGACGLLSCVALWAVLSRRVQDGIVIKVGLGLLLVAGGIALRWRKAGRVYRIDEWLTPPTVRMERDDLPRGSRL